MKKAVVLAGVMLSLVLLGVLVLFSLRARPPIIITVVGNSHGGLAWELERFNEQYEDEGIRAVLVYDWEALNTNERLEHALKVVSGEEPGDVLEMDGVWIPFLSRQREGGASTGMRSLQGLLDRDDVPAFLPSALNAARETGRPGIQGLPLYLDAGMVFYRKDLVGEVRPQDNLDDLLETLASTGIPDDMVGFVFQGDQYEGLNCMFYEALYLVGYQGSLSELSLSSMEALDAAGLMHDWIHGSGMTPFKVAYMREEQSRELFSSGKAVVLRNWPYVLQGWPWDGEIPLHQVGILTGAMTRPVLGGWYLGIPAQSENWKDAQEVLRFLVSEDMALRRATYTDRPESSERSNWRRLPPVIDLVHGLVRDERGGPYYGAIAEVLLQAEPRPSRIDYQEYSRLLSAALFTILDNPECGGTTDQGRQCMRMELASAKRLYRDHEERIR